MEILKKKFPQIIEIPEEVNYDQDSGYWYIQKKANWKVDMQRGFLHFGDAGCDGIELPFTAPGVILLTNLKKQF